jgi:hypothetical protein
MSITRDEIRALCATHDRFMAEQASEPIRRPPMSETEPSGLVYKEYVNDTLHLAAEADAGPSEISDEFIELVADTVLDLEERVARKLAEARTEWEREVATLRVENAELRGKVDVLLNLVTKGGDVVDLPRGNWRRDGVA